MYQDRLAGKPVSRLVLRGHYHAPAHEFLEMDDGTISELYVIPSWSLLNEHSQQATRSGHNVTNGMMLFEFIDGELASRKKLYHCLDVRVEEAL
jgi:hypothetical protein